MTTRTLRLLASAAALLVVLFTTCAFANTNPANAAMATNTNQSVIAVQNVPNVTANVALNCVSEVAPRPDWAVNIANNNANAAADNNEAPNDVAINNNGNLNCGNASEVAPRPELVANVRKDDGTDNVMRATGANVRKTLQQKTVALKRNISINAG